MWKYVGVVVCSILFMAPASFGQIVITSDEIPHEVGMHFVYDYSQDSVVVDIGTPGGSKVWDFTSQETDFSQGTWIVDPAGTPFIDYFPTANLVQKYGEGDAISYGYNRLTTDALTSFGSGIVMPETSMVMAYDEPIVQPLPIGYGGEWIVNAMMSDTFGDVVIVTEFRWHKKADAWGTVDVPYGCFACLRIQGFDTMLTTSYVMGIPMYAGTTAYIGYTFMAENYGSVVSVASHPGETNPNYTNASSLTRLSAFTGIEEENLSLTCELSNFPNPFTKKTEIRYVLPGDGYVNLEVFNIAGEKIKTLVNGFQSKGKRTIRWDASELPAGIYLYRIKTDSGAKTNKMVLLR